jgi:hypothetical protein
MLIIPTYNNGFADLLRVSAFSSNDIFAVSISAFFWAGQI